MRLWGAAERSGGLGNRGYKMAQEVLWGSPREAEEVVW